MSLAALTSHDRSRWHAIAAAARPRIETRLFIDGRFVDAASAGRFTTVNPATGEPLAEMSAGTEADIDRAVAAACGRDSPRGSEWRCFTASPT